MNPKPIELDFDDYAERYSRLCDILERINFPNTYIEGTRNTSNESRQLAMEIFDTLEIKWTAEAERQWVESMNQVGPNGQTGWENSKEYQRRGRERLN